MPDLFVSHATLDDVIADKVADALLEKYDISTWVDHRGGIEPGTPNWDRAIREAIPACDAAVLLMSPRSLASDICQAECLLARELEKPLYIAYIDTCIPEAIWLSIKLIQYTDLRTDFDGGLDKLVRALRGERGPDLPTSIKGKITGIDTMRENLPYLSSVPLTGRDADIEAIQSKLGPHVTQLTAVGGTGKSRVAAEIALAYPHGAIWHLCTPLSSAFEITESVRRHYGLDEKAPEADVLAALDTAPPLIVLDNAEDVPPGSEQRAAYVALTARIAGHGAPLLLTSRAVWDALKPRREHFLAPLDVETAAALACEFAAADGLTLSKDDARALAEAARLHPRLIELAVRQLHERDLPDVLRMLRELKHDDIQEALAEMILKTVRQMAAQAKGGAGAERLLRRLTVFRGPFDRPAIEALKPADMDADGLSDALVVLQRWRFLRRQPNERLLLDDVTIGALPPDEDAAALHFAHYISAHHDFNANNNEDRHPKIEADWPNIRAALAWGWANKPESTVDFAWALHYFMQFRAGLAEHHAMMEAAQATAKRVGYQRGEANTLRALGDLALVQDTYNKSGIFYEDALSLYQSIGDCLGQANTLQALGDLALIKNEYREGRDFYNRALQLGQQLGNLPVCLNALSCLGLAEQQLNNLAAASKPTATFLSYQTTTWF